MPYNVIIKSAFDSTPEGIIKTNYSHVLVFDEQRQRFFAVLKQENNGTDFATETDAKEAIQKFQAQNLSNKYTNCKAIIK